MQTVSIFGSSLPEEKSPLYAEARRLGRLLAENGFAVCNGGYAGLMEASSRGAREANGHTIGVTCALWRAAANPWIAQEIRTASFPERLMKLMELGDAYIVLPGGTGTLVELALAWELMNKQALTGAAGGGKPLLVMGDYWQPVIDCLKKEPLLAGLGLQRQAATMDVVALVSNPPEVIERLKCRYAGEPPAASAPPVDSGASFVT